MSPWAVNPYDHSEKFGMGTSPSPSSPLMSLSRATADTTAKELMAIARDLEQRYLADGDDSLVAAEAIGVIKGVAAYMLNHEGP